MSGFRGGVPLESCLDPFGSRTAFGQSGDPLRFLAYKISRGGRVLGTWKGKRRRSSPPTFFLDGLSQCATSSCGNGFRSPRVSRPKFSSTRTKGKHEKLRTSFGVARSQSPVSDVSKFRSSRALFLVSHPLFRRGRKPATASACLPACRCCGACSGLFWLNSGANPLQYCAALLVPSTPAKKQSNEKVLKEMPSFPEDRESGPEARLRRRYVC